MIDFIKSTDNRGNVCVREYGTQCTYTRDGGARGLRYECDAYSASLARKTWIEQAQKACEFYGI